MSNNKQSSVEWLYNKMYEHRGNITIEEYEQAKAMHKQEVMRAYNASYNGFGLFSDGYALAEIYYDQYYNSTLGGDNEQQ